METTKCPICGSPGIPDYHKEKVTCPHCGSNLEIYCTISEFSKEEAEKYGKSIKKYKVLSVLLPVIVAVLATCTCAALWPSNSGNDNSQIIEKDKIISQLRDSVSGLQSQVQKTASVQKNSIQYVILRNDSPWGIVRKFYGYRKDWESVAQKIAEDNGIWDAETNAWQPIHPGQVLNINKEL